MRQINSSDWATVLLSPTVGSGLVLQHTPLSVIMCPPSSDMLPPQVAASCTMSVTSRVVSMTSVLAVSKVESALYAVPISLTAYALT